MADTKVSGLTAAASFLAAQEFPVNDSGASKKVTGTQIQAFFPWGTLANGYAQVIANQATITTVVDLTGMTVTVTVAAGRRIKITGCGAVQSTVAGDVWLMGINEGATVLSSFEYGTQQSGFNYQAIGMVVLTPSTGSHTYKLTMQRASGTGTGTWVATSTHPAFILAEDIGV